MVFSDMISEAVQLANDILAKNHDNPAFYKYPSTLLSLFLPNSWISRLDLASKWISLDPLSNLAINELYMCYLRGSLFSSSLLQVFSLVIWFSLCSLCSWTRKGVIDKTDLLYRLAPCRRFKDLIVQQTPESFRPVFSDLLTLSLPPIAHEEDQEGDRDEDRDPDGDQEGDRVESKTTLEDQVEREPFFDVSDEEDDEIQEAQEEDDVADDFPSFNHSRRRRLFDD